MSAEGSAPRRRPGRRLLAAGAVVLRGTGEQSQILVVHRPHFKDWSLPKGGLESGELLPGTAVREVQEETGHLVRLGHSLGSFEYQTKGGTKQVHWWRGEVIEAAEHLPDREVDKVEWWSLGKARSRLDYPLDRELLERALTAPPTTPVLVIRHGKAMARRHWTGPDPDRRLAALGRRQAQALVPLLAAFGVQLLASSPSTRCMATLLPYSEEFDLPIIGAPALSEEVAAADPERVPLIMTGLRDQALASGRALAVCGHRPVLPAMLAALGADYPGIKPGASAVLHLDQKGMAVRVDRLPPPL